MSFKTRKDRILANFFTRYPALIRAWAKNGRFVSSADIPWTPFSKDLGKCRIALVTTAGVHLRSQPPFDMEDKEGDSTWREIPSQVDPKDLTITHNYYDHRDGDRDINVVFPVERLREIEAEGVIGGIAPRHFSFMGHIIGKLLETLTEKTGPQVARYLKEEEVDAVFLTPA
jgi:D-proline reductase (dithiol) PrdB